jgi:hypothetical protein
MRTLAIPLEIDKTIEFVRFSTKSDSSRAGELACASFVLLPGLVRNHPAPEGALGGPGGS